VLSFIEGLYGLTPLNSRDANALPPIAAFSSQPDLYLEATHGRAVSYQIPAYNTPTSYAASLGNGLSLNTSTGLITGTPTNVGTTLVPVTVPGAGAQGTLHYQLEIDVH